jgi:hypothetical protein
VRRFNWNERAGVRSLRKQKSNENKQTKTSKEWFDSIETKAFGTCKIALLWMYFLMVATERN